MATLATFFRRFEAREAPQSRTRQAVRVEPDPYRLRTLPNEDVYFYSKNIDNSRLVREADPRAKKECWSTIGAACAIAALLTGVLAPAVAGTMAGYRIQELRAEERRLIDERRVLELEEARLLSPARLQELAERRRFVSPAPGQVTHLSPQGDGSLALNVK
jgi:hypothetical protein